MSAQAQDVFPGPSGTRRRRRVARKGRLMFTVLCTAVICYLWVMYNPMKSVFVRAERLTRSQAGKAYIFRAEETAIIDGEYEFIPGEGEKIAAYTVLSPSPLDAREYLARRRAGLEHLIANPQLSSKEAVRVRIGEVDAALALVQSSILTGWADMDSSERARLGSLAESLTQERAVLARCTQFAGLPAAELERLLEESDGGTAVSRGEFNAYNLNFDVFGNVYYSLDGFEGLMDLAGAQDAGGAYLDYLDSVKSPAPRPGVSVVRSVSARNAVACVRLSADSDVAGLSEAMDLYRDLHLRYEMDAEGGYLEFLFRRTDILVQFPSVDLVFPGGERSSGRLVDWVREGGDLIVRVALTGGLESVKGMRVSGVSLESETYWAYIVPAAALGGASDACTITVLVNSNIKKVVEVSVWEITGAGAVLRVADNPALADGFELLLKGGR